ncbi:MAG: Microtubule-nucleating Tub4p (gamma-tubulin) complex component [Thelocarpon superellum]|nr:MAG: Microtubule-nucleating Tub4p (gamma-tubulin) complex component [Thelocarpon superellum]
MSRDSSARIEAALSSLVDAILPSLPDRGDGNAIDAEIREHGLQIAKDILDGSGASALSSDVNHASDLIKKKLIRDSTSPEKALRFSNLYSRLLTQPVLSQKWAILYFLYQLADAKPTQQYDLYLPPVAASPSLDQRSLSSSREMEPARPGGEPGTALSDAFSNQGLPRLPVREGGQRDRLHADGELEGNQRAGSEEPPRIGNKTTLLAQNFAPFEPTEPALLRDLPFTLQGLASTNLTFSSADALTLPSTLPPPMVSLLHALAEPSLLYRSLSAFVQTADGNLIGQSLRAAVGSELRSYLGLVATLEGEIRRALAMLDETEPRHGIGKTGVTLRRCVVWTRDATMGLRLMSMMVKESTSKKGGQLISLIHGFSSSHGDPFVGVFAERMLSHVTKPFYNMLRQWIYDGELSDPHHEFFVSEVDPDAVDETKADGRRRGGATSVWDDKYRLDDDMIPSIMTKDFAKKVFLIGKSLNFIRYGCGDSTWVEEYSKDASKELRYGDTANLEASIDVAYKTTMARLMHLMADKFKLFDHLTALKKYLLLGQGDFIALLMESLSSSLDRPANTLFRHSLTAQLEHAIRGSNAQYDSPDVLRRLDARMLMQGHGEIGWEIFTLEYKIDAPIDVIVTAEGSREYLKVFNFLWRVKRVEFALGSTWRRCMTGARGVLASVADKVGKDWKMARCCIAEMIHFVCQLQYYILFEVIESSWDELQAAISKPDSTLDDLIDAHARYLKAITHKGLLGSASTRSSASASASSSTNKEDSFLGQLHEILKVMLAYKDAVDGLYSFSVAEYTRRHEFSAKIEARTAQGKWGMTEADEDDLRSPATDRPAHTQRTSSSSGGLLGAGGAGAGAGARAGMGGDATQPTLSARLKTLAVDFRARVNILLGDLAYQPDVDMRFLGVVMNFNDVYEPVRRKTRKDREREREKEREKSASAPSSSVAGAGIGVKT